MSKCSEMPLECAPGELCHPKCPKHGFGIELCDCNKANSLISTRCMFHSWLLSESWRDRARRADLTIAASSACGHGWSIEVFCPSCWKKSQDELEAIRAAEPARRVLIAQMAASIAAGIVPWIFDGDPNDPVNRIANASVEIAEAILARLEKKD